MKEFKSTDIRKERQEVKTYREEAYCPVCIKGRLISTGDAYTNVRSRIYINKCSSCKEEFGLDWRYPAMVYVEKEFKV